MSTEELDQERNGMLAKAAEAMRLLEAEEAEALAKGDLETAALTREQRAHLQRFSDQ